MRQWSSIRCAADRPGLLTGLPIELRARDVHRLGVRAGPAHEGPDDVEEAATGIGEGVLDP